MKQTYVTFVYSQTQKDEDVDIQKDMNTCAHTNMLTQKRKHTYTKNTFTHTHVDRGGGGGGDREGRRGGERGGGGGRGEYTHSDSRENARANIHTPISLAMFVCAHQCKLLNAILQVLLCYQKRFHRPMYGMFITPYYRSFYAIKSDFTD